MDQKGKDYVRLLTAAAMEYNDWFFIRIGDLKGEQVPYSHY